MFRSQGQESTAFRRQRSSRTGRALVLETKHVAHYTHFRLWGQTALSRGLGPARSPRESAGKLGSDQRRTRPQRLQLRPGDRPGTAAPCRSWCRVEAVGRNMLQRRPQGRRDVLRASRPGRWRRRSLRPARPCRGAGRAARAVRASWRIPATPDRSPIARAAERSARIGAIRTPRVFFQSLLALMP